MKVFYEEDYAPFVNYNDAYVYLDTQNEELSITTYYTSDVQMRIDFVWYVPTDLDTDGYNILLDEIKPLAIKLLKHHTIDDRGGHLDEDGETIRFDIERYIAEWLDENGNRRMSTIRADTSDLEEFGYRPSDVSPSKLREIASVGEDPDMGYALYFQDDVEDYENTSMTMIGDDIIGMDGEQASRYLSMIYSTYKADGFASDFEEILLPFLEEEGYIEYVNGDYYLADTEDKIEWK